MSIDDSRRLGPDGEPLISKPPVRLFVDSTTPPDETEWGFMKNAYAKFRTGVITSVVPYQRRTIVTPGGGRMTIESNNGHDTIYYSSPPHEPKIKPPVPGEASFFCIPYTDIRLYNEDGSYGDEWVYPPSIDENFYVNGNREPVFQLVSFEKGFEYRPQYVVYPNLREGPGHTNDYPGNTTWFTTEGQYKGIVLSWWGQASRYIRGPRYNGLWGISLAFPADVWSRVPFGDALLVDYQGPVNADANGSFLSIPPTPYMPHKLWINAVPVTFEGTELEGELVMSACLGTREDPDDPSRTIGVLRVLVDRGDVYTFRASPILEAAALYPEEVVADPAWFIDYTFYAAPGTVYDDTLGQQFYFNSSGNSAVGIVIGSGGYRAALRVDFALNGTCESSVLEYCECTVTGSRQARTGSGGLRSGATTATATDVLAVDFRGDELILIKQVVTDTRSYDAPYESPLISVATNTWDADLPPLPESDSVEHDVLRTLTWDVDYHLFPHSEDSTQTLVASLYANNTLVHSGSVTHAYHYEETGLLLTMAGSYMEHWLYDASQHTKESEFQCSVDKSFDSSAEIVGSGDGALRYCVFGGDVRAGKVLIGTFEGALGVARSSESVGLGEFSNPLSQFFTDGATISNGTFSNGADDRASLSAQRFADLSAITDTGTGTRKLERRNAYLNIDHSFLLAAGTGAAYELDLSSLALNQLPGRFIPPDYSLYPRSATVAWTYSYVGPDIECGNFGGGFTLNPENPLYGPAIIRPPYTTAIGDSQYRSGPESTDQSVWRASVNIYGSGFLLDTSSGTVFVNFGEMLPLDGTRADDVAPPPVVVDDTRRAPMFEPSSYHAEAAAAVEPQGRYSYISFMSPRGYASTGFSTATSVVRYEQWEGLPDGANVDNPIEGTYKFLGMPIFVGKF